MKATIFLVLILSFTVHAQTTTFTYQGRLNDSGVAQPVNGTYDFQFALFDAANAQIGATQARGGVAVTNGVFNVQLDFGVNPFVSGADRFLQIAVKRVIDPTFTTLAPKQPLTSVPYAVQTLNSSSLGGFAVSQFVQVNDSRLTDARDPLPFSANYIQNGNSQQTANFNVSGNGTLAGNLSANSINSTTNFKIGNIPMISHAWQSSLAIGESANHTLVANDSTFVGYRTGFAAGGFSFSNTFVGSHAGEGTTVGWNNTFVGKDAGQLNTNGVNNAYFGASAGEGSGAGSGSQNAAFGFEAGRTVAGSRNSFFGFQSGALNSAANDSAFFGYQSGTATTAAGNSFFGSNSGKANTTGTSNAFFGMNSGVTNTTGGSNSFFGSDAGNLVTSGSANVAVGASAGNDITTGTGNTLVGFQAGPSFNSDFVTAVGWKAGEVSGSASNTFLGSGTTSAGHLISHSTALGAGAVIDESNQIVIGTSADHVKIPGSQTLIFGTLSTGNVVADTVTADDGVIAKLKLTTGTGPGTGTNLCITATSFVVICSSSLRYKTNIVDYTRGLDVVRRLRPITFDWKTDGAHDIGFGAEEVEKVDARLVNYNASGQVEAVKYDRISAALVNAVKEQQQLIDTQQEQIRRQQEMIDGLRTLVCADHADAAICRKENEK